MGNKKGFSSDIETDTKQNTNFRAVLYTGVHSQLVLMSLKPKEEIGEEIHEDIDQFFKIEDGEGLVVINGFKHPVRPGSGVVVPAGTQHNVINTSSSKELKLYTLYSPPEHRDKTIRQTKAEATANEEHFDGKTTE